MPELPEVEVAGRNLRRWTSGRRVRATRVDPSARRILRPSAAGGLAPLAGAAFRDVRRIGKNLLLTFDGRRGTPIGVWSHLGMTGKWLLRARGAGAPRWSRIDLSLDDGSHLHYVDARMFGRFRLVPGARFQDVPELGALGPDPLVDGIDARALHTRLQALKIPIKVALLDQGLLAGIGNIQANEALHRAAIDPRRAARSLSRAEVKRLGAAILKSIQFTLETFAASGADGGSSDMGYVEEGDVPNPFLVYGREGEPCPRCPARRHSTITRIVQAQRATFFCPNCQH
jgi:formamidopyrimidine-DNA glycosylase